MGMDMGTGVLKDKDKDRDKGKAKEMDRRQDQDRGRGRDARIESCSSLIDIDPEGESAQIVMHMSINLTIPFTVTFKTFKLNFICTSAVTHYKSFTDSTLLTRIR